MLATAVGTNARESWIGTLSAAWVAVHCAGLQGNCMLSVSPQIICQHHQVTVVAVLPMYVCDLYLGQAAVEMGIYSMPLTLCCLLCFHTDHCPRDELLPVHEQQGVVQGSAAQASRQHSHASDGAHK